MDVCMRASSLRLNSCLSRHTIHYNLVNRFSALSYYRSAFYDDFRFRYLFLILILFGSNELRIESRSTPTLLYALRIVKNARENHPLNANMAIFDSIRNVKSELKALILFPVATIFAIGTMLKLIVRGLNRMCALSICYIWPISNFFSHQFSCRFPTNALIKLMGRNSERVAVKCTEWFWVIVII